MVEVKERLENGIDVLSISNSHLTVEVTNFGCTLLKIVTKDKNDQDCDCILGFEHVEDYQKRDGTYLNALVGRVCNRIEKGTFTINDTEYHVPINNGPNSLHGGIEGFSYKVFDYSLIEDGVKFHYVSKDGEQKDTFTLSGWFRSYTGTGMAFLSESYCQEHGYTLQNSGVLSISLDNPKNNFYDIQDDITLNENQTFQGSVSMSSSNGSVYAMIIFWYSLS